MLGQYFSTNSAFLKKISQVALQAKVPMQKASYIDPLILKFSLKSEFCIWMFN